MTATCASNLPNADADTPSPSASTALPHSGHKSRCSRCSITNGTTSGSSHFCRRTDSRPVPRCRQTDAHTRTGPAHAQRDHRPARVWQAPGSCPHAPLPATLLTTLLLRTLTLPRATLLPGQRRIVRRANELFVESRFNSRSCSSTRSRNALISANSPSTSSTALSTRPRDPFRIRNTHERKIPCD